MNQNPLYIAQKLILWDVIFGYWNIKQQLEYYYNLLLTKIVQKGNANKK